MTNRIVQFAGIMLAALVTGVFWGTWFTLTRSLDSFSAAEFLHIGKTGRIGVDARIGGGEDVPEAQDEELQGLRLARRN